MRKSTYGKLFIMCTIVLMFVIMNASVVSAFAPNDIGLSSEYAKQAILGLVEQKIVKGDEKGNFNPHKTVTRTEMVVFVVNTLGINATEAPKVPTFKDMPKDHWAYKQVEAAYREGIIKGIAIDKFGTNDVCTREQITAIFVRALNALNDQSEIKFNHINYLSDKNKISEWARRDVEVALATGLMKGISTDSFGPKDYAKREQVAVLIDRFLKNREKIIHKINSDYNKEKELTIMFNGDSIALENKPIIESDNILVPLEFFDKYIAVNINSSYIAGRDTIYLESPPSYIKDNINHAWIKLGDTRAYRNLPEFPKEDKAEYRENLTLLNAAPRLIDGVVYVGLEDLSRIFGLEYSFDKSSNTTNVKDNRLNQYPNLFYAVMTNSYLPYVGRIETKGTVFEKDLMDNTYYQVDYSIAGHMNKTDGYAKANYVIEGSDIKKESIKYEEILLGDKYYSKDMEDNKWIVLDKNEAQINLNGIFLDMPFDGEAYGIMLSNNLYRNYRKLPIKKVGNVMVDGMTTTKYTMQLDAAALKALIPQEQYSEEKEVLDILFGGRIDYTLELYLTNDYLVKQVYKFYSRVNDPAKGYNWETKFDIEANYKDIGKVLEIIPPDKSMIKPYQ